MVLPTNMGQTGRPEWTRAENTVGCLQSVAPSRNQSNEDLVKREHIWMHHEQDAKNYWKLAEGGYPSRMSVRAGEQIELHISNSRSYYDIFVFREGANRELLKTIYNLKGQLQPVPELGYRDGFGWKASISFEIPRHWKSGIYVASFPTAQGMRE